jgi:uncharacterized protein YecT (DUF1311 family)
MIASLILPLLLQSAPMQEAPPVASWNCDDPLVQQEMNWCAGQDLASAEQALEVQWQAALAAMKEQDAQYAAISGFEPDAFLMNLLESQIGWWAYRDAQCALDGFSARGGSLEPLLVATCKARLTRMRTEELRDMADNPE